MQPWRPLVEHMDDNLLVYKLERPPIFVRLHNLDRNLGMKLKLYFNLFINFEKLSILNYDLKVFLTE